MNITQGSSLDITKIDEDLEKIVLFTGVSEPFLRQIIDFNKPSNQDVVLLGRSIEQCLRTESKLLQFRFSPLRDPEQLLLNVLSSVGIQKSFMTTLFPCKNYDFYYFFLGLMKLGVTSCRFTQSDLIDKHNVFNTKHVVKLNNENTKPSRIGMARFLDDHSVVVDKHYNLKFMSMFTSKFNVSEHYYTLATTHLRHPNRNYSSKFFELAVVGDSVIQLLLNKLTYELGKNPGQMNDFLKRFASNKFNSDLFNKLCFKFDLRADEIIESYEIQASKSDYSEKIKETCFEALVGAIVMSNLSKSLVDIGFLYDSFVELCLS